MSKRFVLIFLFSVFCSLFSVFTGCERKKDRGNYDSSLSNIIFGGEGPATLTDDEAFVIAEIVQCGLIVNELTGGYSEVPENETETDDSIKKVSPGTAKTLEELLKKITKGLAKQKLDLFLGGIGGGGILGWALLFGELTTNTQQESMVDYIRRSLTNQQLKELRNIKAGPDGWITELIGSGYVVLSRVTRIDGAYAKSLEDLVKVRQNTPSAQKVIKRIEIKVISGGSIEQYTGITDPASKTPSVLHTISYVGREVLSAGFSYNVDMKIWYGVTITKKTSVGATATCTPSSNGVDWVLEGPGWRQQWKFSYESIGRTWSGFFAVKLWDADGKVLLDLKNEQSGTGLLSVLSLFTAGGVPLEGALVY